MKTSAQPDSSTSSSSFQSFIVTNVIRNDVNVGAGASRNIGVNASHGDIIFFCDSEDLVRSEITHSHHHDAITCWNAKSVVESSSLSPLRLLIIFFHSGTQIIWQFVQLRCVPTSTMPWL